VSYLVAKEDGVLLAVGGIFDNGGVNLNYVSPDARFRGSARLCCERSKDGPSSVEIDKPF
jgi:hypothetical protein